MKKRLIAIILPALLLFTGCRSKSPRYQYPLNFYYLQNVESFQVGDSAVKPEIRDRKPYADDNIALLDLYLKGPEDDAFTSPFPDNVTTESWEKNGDSIIVTLSPSFAEMTGYRLTTACICLSMTVLEMTQAQSVVIQADGCKLDGSESITMTADQFVTYDPSSSAAP